MAICVYESTNNIIKNAGELLDGCTGYILLTPEDYTQINETLLGLDVATFFGGNFDADVAGVGFLGVVSLFVTGLGVGLIINMIRKLR